MKYLILLFIPFCVACEENLNFVDFTFTPQLEDSAKFRMDGFYYSPAYNPTFSRDSSDLHYSCTVFYKNGVFVSVAVASPSSQEVIDKVNSFSGERYRYEIWGIFRCEENTIYLEWQAQHGHKGTDWFLRPFECEIVNDSTLVNIVDEEKVPDDTDFYHFIESAEKPDSILFPFVFP